MKTEIWERFSKVNVLIVGDVMLDRYWWGSVSRISPEAPVPIVNLENTTLVAGGAANVAANVSGLGAKAFLIGLTGDDDESELLPEILKKHSVSSEFLVKSSNRRTIVKTRVIAHNQQVVRIDQEIKSELNDEEEERIWTALENLLTKIDIIIVSDYNKGTITAKLMARLIKRAAEYKLKVLVDPKGKNYKKYFGAAVLTPNRFEVAEVHHLENFEQKLIEKAGKKMLVELSLEALLITQGEDGMTLFENDENINHISVTARNVYDVTGAGDTVIACLGVAVGSGFNFLESAKFANIAAGLVVEQIGTTAISRNMLGDNYDVHFNLNTRSDKDLRI